MPFDPIRTERLVLRPPEPGDAPRIHRLIGEWEVARMTANVPHPYEAGMAEDWIAKTARRLVAGEACQLAVIDSEAGGAVGGVGLDLDDRAAPVLGYWIGRPYWGLGYATEAVGALVAFGFDALGAERIDATVLPANTASARVLGKLGFVRTGRVMQDAPARGARQEVDTYALSRTDHGTVGDG